MRTLRDPLDVERVTDPGARSLFARRFEEVADGEEFDADVFGYFVLVEAGDTVELLCQATGVDLLGTHEPASGSDSVRAWECITDHPCFYEMVYIRDDSGYGVVFVLPKHEDVDPRLLDLCRRFAAPEPAAP